ncbi:MAG: hypothetical protein V4690_00060 [Patescibacteria group bacterium]
MKNEKRKKGDKFFWIGFISGIIFRVIPFFATADTYPELAQFVPLFDILGFVSLVILMYGCILVLQSKNRHWAWALLILILNIFGVIIIYMLKDESEAVTPTPVPAQTPVKDIDQIS